MPELIEPGHAGSFVISKARGNQSLENGILQSGQNLRAGAVLGKTATAGGVAGAASAGNTGNGTITGLSIGGAAKTGVYKAICIEPAAGAGRFEVEDPEGVIIGRATAGTPFTGPINFTINDGTPDFVEGDIFEITVSQLTQKYKVLAPSGTDGSQFAAGILLADVDASAADAKCAVITRQTEVHGNELLWPGGITAAQQDLAVAQLAARRIIVR